MDETFELDGLGVLGVRGTNELVDDVDDEGAAAGVTLTSLLGRAGVFEGGGCLSFVGVAGGVTLAALDILALRAALWGNGLMGLEAF